MGLYEIIITVIAVFCVIGVVFLVIKLFETKKVAEVIAADNLKKGASCIIQIQGIPRKKVEIKIPQCKIRLLTLDG